MAKGYAWLPGRRRRTTAQLVRTRLMGQEAVALHGPEAVRFFYDERRVERRTALPGPVLSTLFGHGAVHTLDGRDHRERKGMFLRIPLNRMPARVRSGFVMDVARVPAAVLGPRGTPS